MWQTWVENKEILGENSFKIFGNEIFFLTKQFFYMEHYFHNCLRNNFTLKILLENNFMRKINYVIISLDNNWFSLIDKIFWTKLSEE